MNIFEIIIISILETLVIFMLGVAISFIPYVTLELEFGASVLGGVMFVIMWRIIVERLKNEF